MGGMKPDQTFSLRSLLILAAFVAVVGWGEWRVKMERQQTQYFEHQYRLEMQKFGKAVGESMALREALEKLKAETAVTVSWTEGASAVYDGLPHGAKATWASTGSDGEGGSLAVLYYGINGTDFNPSETPPTEVGEYGATAQFNGDGKHRASGASADFKIVRPSP